MAQWRETRDGVFALTRLRTHTRNGTAPYLWRHAASAAAVTRRNLAGDA